MVFLETLQAFLFHLFLTYILVHGFKLSSIYVFLGAAAPVFMIVLRIALITSVAVVATSVRGGSNLTHHPSLFFFFSLVSFSSLTRMFHVFPSPFFLEPK